MSRDVRVAVIILAICAGFVGALNFFLSVGKGLASPVSNCNRNCDDGTANLDIAIVCGGVAVILTVVALVARKRKPPPAKLPEARLL